MSHCFADKKPCISQCLPVLELDSGLVLASVNQAARYLLPPPNDVDVEVDQWLEWESSQLQVKLCWNWFGKMFPCSTPYLWLIALQIFSSLQPAVVFCLSNPGKNDNRLKSLLSALDKAISSNEYLGKVKELYFSILFLLLWICDATSLFHYFNYFPEWSHSCRCMHLDKYLPNCCWCKIISGMDW